MGDCYLISSLSSLTKHEEFIRNKIFITKNVNKAGIYTLRLFVRGKPWLITIDDEFAFRNTG